MRSRLRDAWAERNARERGVVLAFMGLVLFTLVIMAGLAIDVANWWWTGQKLQKTADAAAMAGVTYLPDDLSSAQTTAKDTTKRNGYADGGNATVTAGVGSRPTELKVEVQTDVDNFFTSIIGFKKTTVKRTAVADYTGSVPMGSPADYLGQDPEVPGRQDNLWLSIASPTIDKANGDRYLAYTCSTSTFGCGTGTPKNNEYLFDGAGTTNKGYRYVVKVESITAGQPLVFQIYDPAHIVTGLTCGGNNMPTGMQVQNLQAAYSNDPTYGTFFNDAETRYARGRNTFCPGDDDLWPGGSGAGPGDVAYIVRGPDDTPWNDTDNPVVCIENFRPIDTGLYKYLDPTDPEFRWGEDPNVYDGPYVRKVFHRWVPICSISTGIQTGDYIIQVRTNHDPDDPETYAPDFTKGGASRFSIRAGFQASAGAVPGGSNVNVFANGKLPLYVNGERNTTSTFYLARILPSAAGRTLLLDFFDIGDIGSGTAAVSVQIVPPSEYAATFSGCTFKRDDAAPQSSANCMLTGLNSGNHQGRLESVSVPIPSNYNCDTVSDTGCWVKVKMAFNNDANPTDVTTWTARVDGDPIRLVK